MGPLKGGPQCSLSILRNDNVPCLYFPVDLKVVHCRPSILRNGNVPCQYFWHFPVDFKVVQCRLSNLIKCGVALFVVRVNGPTALWSGMLLYYLTKLAFIARTLQIGGSGSDF